MSDFALARAREVRLMGFDVDGVLTDGRLYFTAEGDTMKAFHSRDGLGMKLLANAGIKLALITGRKSALVERRAENLGIDLVFQGVEDKRAVMAQLLAREGLDFAQAGYMGDDIVDLAIMGACGFAATVPDAHARVKQLAHYVAKQPAGAGAAREVCELILQAQGKFDAALAPHLGIGPG
jgi:3-deoxy-D-manno-octulosonate 8-phosphate phosphatase (KDO 8-P phosphatase)